MHDKNLAFWTRKSLAVWLGICVARVLVIQCEVCWERWRHVLPCTWMTVKFFFFLNGKEQFTSDITVICLYYV